MDAFVLFPLIGLIVLFICIPCKLYCRYKRGNQLRNQTALPTTVQEVIVNGERRLRVAAQVPGTFGQRSTVTVYEIRLNANGASAVQALSPPPPFHTALLTSSPVLPPIAEELPPSYEQIMKTQTMNGPLADANTANANNSDSTEEISNSNAINDIIR